MEPGSIIKTVGFIVLMDLPLNAPTVRRNIIKMVGSIGMPGPRLKRLTDIGNIIKNGKLYRENGPNIERPDGTVEYWENVFASF